MTEGKKINQYELNGFELRLVDTYNSISEASRKTGIAQPNISAVLNGRTNSAGGYFWRFTDGKFCPLIQIPNSFPFPIAQIEIFNGMVKKIYPSIQQASKISEIDPSMISKCLKGEIDRTGSCTWRYITDLTEEQKTCYHYYTSPYKIEEYEEQKEPIKMERKWPLHDENFGKIEIILK